MREVMGGAFDSSDLGEKLGEGDRDRIAALAGASRLGSALWRLKYGNDPAVYKIALFLLCKRMKFGDAKVLQRLAELAIHEWMMPMCQTCNGAKELIVGDLRAVCSACEGAGVKRYTDRERERFMTLPPRSWEKWQKKYESVQAVMTGEDIRVNTTVAYRLER